MPAMMVARCAVPAAALGFTDTGVVDSYLMDFDGAAPPPPAPARKLSRVLKSVGRLLGGAPDPQEQTRPQASREVRIAVKAGQHVPAHGAVLFDSANATLPQELQFTSLALNFVDAKTTADALDAGLTLLLYIDDAATPRAKVILADVLRLGGTRPLNLRRDKGQLVRLVLDDPNGAWSKGVPALEIVLTLA